MSFSPITPWEIGVGRPITHGLWDKVRRNFDDHQMRLATAGMGTGQIPNGSFEIDANNDGIPDGWTRHLYPGGSGILIAEPVALAHGARSFTFIHPGGVGNGGGFLESDFVEVDSLIRKTLHFILWSSVPGVRNMVQISFFNHARVFLSDVLAYNSTANPGAPTYFIRNFTPPVGTRFIRIVLIGGHPSVNVAGQTVFDGISLGDMPFWKSRRGFTIAEHSASSTAWADAGSASYNLEFNSNIPIDLRFWAEVRTSFGADVFQRFRVGTVFSNEVSVFGSVLLSEFRFPLFVLSNITMSSIITIVQQLRVATAGVTVFGRKPPEGLFQPTTCEYAIS
ncbi:MAG: hypothetical protein DDT18_01516 [Actinobacteria bacterium]|nr:hypothetical protein [Actinomycetota bacterium]